MKTGFAIGDQVEWNTPHGKVHGIIEKIFITNVEIKGHVYKASPEDPQFLVKNEKSGILTILNNAEIKKKPD